MSKIFAMWDILAVPLKTASNSRYPDTDLEHKKYKTRHSTGLEFMLAYFVPRDLKKGCLS